MIFTGSALTFKRNFYTQTGNYGFVMEATVDNTSGTYHFGLSGAAGTLDFKLESGKMYWGDQFVHSYRSYESFVVEAQFTSGAANVIKDNSPLIYGGPKATGVYDYFYFSRANAGMGGEFDVQISGNLAPVYAITQYGYLSSTGQDAVTGWFSNQGSFPIKVFDSTIQATANYSFGKLSTNIGAGGSGAFSYTGDYSTIDFSEPILTTFATNFGNADVLFSIIDARSFDYFVQLTGPTDFGFNSSNVMNRDVSYLNFSGGVVSDGFNSNLFFSLGYISGSGLFAALDDYSVVGLGRFNQSGSITGLVTTTTGSFPTTGFAWATGAATGFFSGLGTGIASGINYTGLAVGTFTGRATGFIFDGSGTLTVGYPLVGVGLNGLSLFPTGAATFATGYIDFSFYNDADGLSISNPDSSVAFTMRPAGGIGDNPAPSCVGDGTYLMDTFSQITGIAPCISGLAGIGVSAVYNGFNIIYLTATTAGVLANDIIVSTDWSSPGDGNLMGGADGSGPTGVVVYPVGTPYTGAFSATITGSGSYQGNVTGLYYIPYAKTFTGTWDLLTGGSPTSLVSVRQPGQFTETLMSGRGTFLPNSYLNLQVTYHPSGDTPDGALLIISGDGVINPIYQALSLP